MEPPGTTNDLLEPYIKINFNGSMVIHNKREQNKKKYIISVPSHSLSTLEKSQKGKKTFFFVGMKKNSYQS